MNKFFCCKSCCINLEEVRHVEISEDADDPFVYVYYRNITEEDNAEITDPEDIVALIKAIKDYQN